jgi:hypothetical protein
LGIEPQAAQRADQRILQSIVQRMPDGLVILGAEGAPSRS